jgi:hypothetical protein
VYVNLGVSITKVRRDIPIVSHTVVQAALHGSPKETALIMSIYNEGGPDPALLASLRQAIGARYLVLSRLSYDQHPVGSPANTVESTLAGTVSLLDMVSGQVVWEGKFTSTKSGVDSLISPLPSVHAQPFFSTIVDAWPSGS